MVHKNIHSKRVDTIENTNQGLGGHYRGNLYGEIT